MHPQLAAGRVVSVNSRFQRGTYLTSSASSGYGYCDTASTCSGEGSMSSVSTAPEDPNAGIEIYPCYMFLYLGCERNFTSGEEEAWFSHICDHMRDTYPIQSSCIFCAQSYPSISMNPNDKKDAFHACMMHTARHFRNWRQEPRGPRNPDRLMLKHLVDHGIIEQKYYDWAALVPTTERAGVPLVPLPLVVQAATSARSVGRSEDIELTQMCDFARGLRAPRKRPSKQSTKLECYI